MNGGGCERLMTGGRSAVGVTTACLIMHLFVFVSSKRLDVNVFGFMSRDQDCRRVGLQVQVCVRLSGAAWSADVTAFRVALQ